MPVKNLIKSSVLAVGLLMAGSVSLAQAQDIQAEQVVIAHRGASGYLPEHTLPAKALAYGMGADYIEQDVVLSKDGVPVVLHDIHLDTTTDVARKFPDRKRDDGRYYVIDFTLAELKSLTVTERFKADSGKQVYENRFPGDFAMFEIPTLEEEIKLIQGLNHSTGRDVGIYPEIKDPAFHRGEGLDIAKTVISVLEKWGYNNPNSNSFVQCFDWAETQRIRNELHYQGKLVQLLGENRWGAPAGTDYDYLKSGEGIVEMAKVVDGIGPWLPQVISGLGENGKATMTPTLIAAQRAQLLVHPYTLRADQLPKWAGDMNIALTAIFDDAGINGIFTDFPDQVVQFLARNPAS
ncbi:glycerophosphodiester phosphodiesterase [Thalassospira sp. GO-4]|jgi:glycerophosphoryl diester phosphodiesterase|uniref:glycerophosphodiester phosphodiesterase n=1 Tax=Thalassospira sp. GO-4 TaxID=2946605 RepID=UPI002024E4E9|nr:glycerophosphodiester phosphodiesterase [Thalassospira sp. GO-4]URK19563.1 glycerophosphodiester phosphodiesterase [Thalassospira sp. GO-4]